MKDDHEALDWLYQDILRRYPPGERRGTALARLYNMATYTECPNWKPPRPQPVLKLCDSTRAQASVGNQPTHGEK